MSLVFKTPKSTLNTTTGEGQNIGYGDCPECPECPKVELSDVDVEYTENGEYTLTPEGDGFSSVGITVNIDTQAIEDAAYAEGEAAGIITGKAQGVAEQKAKLESATFVSNGTYTKEDGYNEVTVNVPSDVNNQTKNVTISSNGTETITADSGYSGLGSVEVTVDVPEKQLTDTLRTYIENGEYTITPTEGYDGFSEVNVSVQIDEQAIYQDGFNSGLDAGIAEQKAKLTSTTFSSNDTFTNEDGWNEVTVDVQPNLDVLEVTPSTQSQQFLPESGYDGFSQVDVDPVTSAIDSNITASNIKKDVTILGVTGSYDPQPNLETGTFTIDTIGTTTFTPDRADGFDSVEITIGCPWGSYGCPFDSPARAVETDYETACYLAIVQSGEINERTGYYDATGQGSIFHIKPYISDGGDPVTFSFPEDFDLTDRSITVEYNKSDLSPIYDRETLVGVEINDCSLLSIDDNGNPDTWPFGTLRVTENGSVDPTGYAEIDVEVNPTLQTKSVVPSDRQQVITPDRDYDGLSEVTVSGVTAAIDQNITASNIKDGVTILGVTGTYDPQPSLESKTASYTANGTYTITPSTGYDGMDEVEVTVNVAGGSGTQCPDWSSIGWDCNDVANSGLEADIAFTAQAKAEFEAGTITNFNTKALTFAPNITLPSNSSSLFANQGKLQYLPEFGGTPTNVNSMFQSCPNLEVQPQFDWSEVTTASQVFYITDISDSIKFNPEINAPKCTNFNSAFSSGTYSNRGMTSAIINAPKAEKVVSMFMNERQLTSVDLSFGTGTLTTTNSMFKNCASLRSIPLFDTSNVEDMAGMFSECSTLTTIPEFNTSNVVYMNSLFNRCDKITSIPQLNAGKVKQCNSIFSPAAGGYGNLTSLGGFINLGKAFVSTDAAMYHIVNLKLAPKLTKESIMNVINNLAAPDDTAVTNAQLMLSATSYALLNAEDIAIATAKRWSVVSA